MTNMLVQLKVKDYSTWRKVYDANVDFRRSSGALSDKIFHDESDPNKVVILFGWDSLADAKKFASSPQLKANQQKAGILGEPNVSYLSEA